MSVRFRIDVPPHVAEVIRSLPPEVKRGVKEALRLLGRDPAAGEPLRRELRGLWKYRVRRFRIVYESTHRVVRVVAVGHHRTIYDVIGEQLRVKRDERSRSPSLRDRKGAAEKARRRQRRREAFRNPAGKAPSDMPA